MTPSVHSFSYTPPAPGTLKKITQPSLSQPFIFRAESIILITSWCKRKHSGKIYGKVYLLLSTQSADESEQCYGKKTKKKKKKNSAMKELYLVKKKKKRQFTRKVLFVKDFLQEREVNLIFLIFAFIGSGVEEDMNHEFREQGINNQQYTIGD